MKYYWIAIVVIIIILILLFLNNKEKKVEFHKTRRILNPNDSTSWWAWGGKYYGSPQYKSRKSCDPLGKEISNKPPYDPVFMKEVMPPFPRPQPSYVC